MFLRCLSGLGTTWLGSTRSGNATREQGVALKGDLKDVNNSIDMQICHLQACRERRLRKQFVTMAIYKFINKFM